MATDTRAIRQFAEGKIAKLSVPAAIASASLWEVKPFRSNSAVSKMLGLMLAFNKPLDLLNGQRVDVGKSLSWSNDKEYHHFFPQAYLARRRIGASKANVVGNIVLLTSKSNIDIRDSAPSEYLNEIIEREGRDNLVRRMESNLVPKDALDAALADDYGAFLKIRAQHVHQVAQAMAGISYGPPLRPEDIEDADDDPTE
ncbi:hypothetical protein [Micromonospora cremea]|uniref:hypothetical protein n=1 Tax=Micromonospora cremea TaxID=709881 RepID=UPI001AD838CD|nr:hypothetical protein [Micromonospora cremea]